MVELPPFGGPAHTNTPCLAWVRLRDAGEWFVAAPVILELEHGIVMGLCDPNSLELP